jgi:hypothetical protein
VADARRRDEVEHAIHQTVPGAQDRDKAELLALEPWRHEGFEWRGGLDHLGFEVATDLVGEQQADLAQQGPELRSRGPDVAHERQFVLHQWMRDDSDVG